MKKFYMILAALLIGSVCFAQRQTIKLDKPIPASNERSAWVGNTGIDGIDVINSGDEYAIAPKEVQNIAAGNTITKVKFYSDATHYATYGATNTSYTIKIYENVTLGGDLAQAGLYDITSTGTAVYTQDVTATDGWNEVTLTTPYTVTANNFWVAIHANGTSCIFFGEADPNSEGAYYNYYTADEQLAAYAANYGLTVNVGDKFWTIPEYCVDEECTSMEIDPIALAVFVEDGQAYVENSDLEAVFLANAQGTALAPSTMNLAEGQDLVLYPTIINNGPDATNGAVTVTLKIDNETLSSQPLSQSIPAGQAIILQQQGSNSFTIPSDYLPETNFNICLVIEYAGTDNNLNNNTSCIAVTRGSNPSTYTITVRANNDAFGTVSGGGSFAAGASTTLTATPNQGYAFVKWQEDDNTDNPRTITVNGDATYTAVFAAVGAVDDETISGIVVYPNPVNDMFTVANAEGATIVVVNSLGQVVTSIENAASNQTIDASSLATGTYFVKVNEKIVKINVVK